MRKYGLSVLPYFPLASGLLERQVQARRAVAGRLRGSAMARRAPAACSTSATGAIVEALSAFAAARGHTLLELAMSWLASRPFIPSIIAGATKAEQVEQNIAAVDWSLSSADLAEIDRITL